MCMLSRICGNVHVILDLWKCACYHGSLEMCMLSRIFGNVHVISDLLILVYCIGSLEMCMLSRIFGYVFIVSDLWKCACYLGSLDTCLLYHIFCFPYQHSRPRFRNQNYYYHLCLSTSNCFPYSYDSIDVSVFSFHMNYKLVFEVRII